MKNYDTILLKKESLQPTFQGKKALTEMQKFFAKSQYPVLINEENEFAYFDTHYYGGIKKYQWTAIPLALHGVVTKLNGENVNVVIETA